MLEIVFPRLLVDKMDATFCDSSRDSLQELFWNQQQAYYLLLEKIFYPGLLSVLCVIAGSSRFVFDGYIYSHKYYGFLLQALMCFLWI